MPSSDLMPLYAEVILPIPVKMTYSYNVPQHLLADIKIGQGVFVPLASRNEVKAIIKDLYHPKSPMENIRDISSIINLQPIANERQFKLWSWMADYYMCSEGDIIRNNISGGLNLLKTKKKELSLDQINLPNIVLSNAQELALQHIHTEWEQKQTVLLHGVTSSGKTEIYIRLIAETLSQGKQVLFMLPEISITAQMILRLKKVFGNRVMQYHSRLRTSKRAEIWHSMIDNKEPILVLGVRSSIFLPFSNLGLIIIDEEHDSSYKQIENPPRYNARDTAIVLAKIHNAKTLLGSATPSVETLFNAHYKKYGKVVLTERYSKVALPKVIVLDIAKARRQHEMKHPIFHPSLINAISDTINAKEQVLVFQNRRGFASFLQCEQCGYVPKCRYCDVSLTLHKQTNKLVCHYCGYSIPALSNCPNCNHNSIKQGGIGTERIVEELSSIFPNAKIARIDTDIVKTANDWKNLITKIETKEIDILVGTQMISKGFDFKNITLTVIPNIDSALNLPDFRAYERCYQIITQVGGRAGRRDKQGLVIIQANDAKHHVIECLKNYNQGSLVEREFCERMNFLYPPYVKFIKIILCHSNQAKCKEAAYCLAKDLRLNFKHILGPESPNIEKLRSFYHQEILIKLLSDKKLPINKVKIAKSIENLQSNYPSIQIHMDIDP